MYSFNRPAHRFASRSSKMAAVQKAGMLSLMASSMLPGDHPSIGAEARMMKKEYGETQPDEVVRVFKEEYVDAQPLVQQPVVHSFKQEPAVVVQNIAQINCAPVQPEPQLIQGQPQHQFQQQSSLVFNPERHIKSIPAHWNNKKTDTKLAPQSCQNSTQMQNYLQQQGQPRQEEIVRQPLRFRISSRSKIIKKEYKETKMIKKETRGRKQKYNTEEERKAAQRRYTQTFLQKHGASYSKDYYQKNLQKQRAYHKDYVRKNKDQIYAYQKKWRSENRARIRESARIYRDRIKREDPQRHEQRKAQRNEYAREYAKRRNAKNKQLRQQTWLMGRREFQEESWENATREILKYFENKPKEVQQLIEGLCGILKPHEKPNVNWSKDIPKNKKKVKPLMQILTVYACVSAAIRGNSEKKLTRFRELVKQILQALQTLRDDAQNAEVSDIAQRILEQLKSVAKLSVSQAKKWQVLFVKALYEEVRLNRSSEAKMDQKPASNF